MQTPDDLLGKQKYDDIGDKVDRSRGCYQGFAVNAPALDTYIPNRTIRRAGKVDRNDSGYII